MRRTLFFRLSSFFSFALTVSQGLLPWHSDCCHCSAPKRRLRVQKGGSGKGDVSQCWPQNWGELHAGIFFLVLSCDGLTLLPYLFNRVSCLLCLFSVFILPLSRFVVLPFLACLISRLSSLVSLRHYHFYRLSSIFMLPSLSSLFTFLSFL
jgi:hypothetical protein